MRRPYKHIDLDEKFSDFEYTPNDSVWENISGGINSKRAPGNLAEKFSGFEVAPSKEAWNGVTAAVNPNGRRKLIAFWLRTGAAAAVFIGFVFGLSGIEYNNHSAYSPRGINAISELAQESTNTELDAQSNAGFRNKLESILSTNLNVNEVNALKENQSVLAKNTPVTSDLKHTSNSGQNKHYQTDKKNNLNTFSALNSSDNKESIAHAPNLMEDDSTIIFKIARNHIEPIRVSSIITDYLASDRAIQPVPVQPIFNSKKVWDLKFSGLLAERTSNISRFTSEESSGSALITVDSFDSESFDFAAANSFEEIGFTSAEEFSTPISFSVNGETRVAGLRKERLKLGLGLGFLKFKSKIPSSGEDSGLQEEILRERNYATVPLYLKYNFIEKKKLDVYLKSGTTVELSLSGKQERITSLNQEEIERTQSSLTVGSGQINLNAGIGSEFKISNRIHGFGEISLARYVAESDYTFWSNQTYWPFINTGITLKLH